MAFHFLVQRIEEALQAGGQRGFLVADENREVEQLLIDDLDDFKQTSAVSGRSAIGIRQIIGSIHFVRSCNNRLIQLADVVAYLILRGRRTQSNLAVRYAEAGNHQGSGVSLEAWSSSHAGSGELADQALYRRLTPLVRASKVFPA